MNDFSNRFDTNAGGWEGPGGPQDIFYTRDGNWPLPRIVRAEGITLWDEHGDKYIDVSSGPIVSNLGHGNKRIADAMKAQVDRLSFSYCRVSRTDENVQLAEAVARRAGEGFERVFMVSGGSEAIDIAIKFARQLAWSRGEKDRRRLFSFLPSYHGGTIATLALSGDLATEEVFEGMAVMPERLEAPLTYRPPDGLTQEENEDRIADDFEQRIRNSGPENCLALFLEPVGGLASGANVMSGRFLAMLRKICDRYGLLMVFDEVMSGAGRTGRFLTAHYHPDARPDLVVLAKGIGAGYAPLGLMLAPASLVDPLAAATGFNYGHTANANPIACAVGIAALEELDTRNVLANVLDVGGHFRNRLEGIAENSPVVGDVRGMGLLLGIEIVADKTSKQSFDRSVRPPDILRRIGLDHGLSLYARRTNEGRFGDWLMACPPLITTRQEADDIADRLETLFTAFVDEMTRNGVRIGA